MTTVIKEGYSIETINRLLEKLQVKKRHFVSKKYSGILKLKMDPVAIQKKLRDEWE